MTSLFIIPVQPLRLGLCVIFFALALMLLPGCETHPGSGQWNQPGASQEQAFEVMGQTAHPPPPGAELMPAIIGPPPDPSVQDLIYRIGPYDELKVDVFGVPELSTEAQVNLQGLIALPLLGPVTVNGLTPGEAEEEIKRQLASRYLRDPRVIVYVKNSASLNVTISGAVGGQGLQPIRGRKTLTDILAQAGGVTPLGKKNQVVLYRREGPDGVGGEGKIHAYVIDYQQILDGRMRDPLVVGNDHIYVPSSGLAIFFSPLVNILQTWALPAARGGY